MRVETSIRVPPSGSVCRDLIIRKYVNVDFSLLRNYPFKDIPKILHLPFKKVCLNVLKRRLTCVR